MPTAGPARQPAICPARRLGRGARLQPLQSASLPGCKPRGVCRPRRLCPPPLLHPGKCLLLGLKYLLAVSAAEELGLEALLTRLTNPAGGGGGAQEFAAKNKADCCIVASRCARGSMLLQIAVPPGTAALGSLLPLLLQAVALPTARKLGLRLTLAVRWIHTHAVSIPEACLSLFFCLPGSRTHGLSCIAARTSDARMPSGLGWTRDPAIGSPHLSTLLSPFSDRPSSSRVVVLSSPASNFACVV